MKGVSKCFAGSNADATRAPHRRPRQVKLGLKSGQQSTTTKNLNSRCKKTTKAGGQARTTKAATLVDLASIKPFEAFHRHCGSSIFSVLERFFDGFFQYAHFVFRNKPFLDKQFRQPEKQVGHGIHLEWNLGVIQSFPFRACLNAAYQGAA
jgi:hypothetical protein